jgi:hypothetical protein
VTGPPAFVGIGAQKSGTSWWYDVIAGHPDVYHPGWMAERVWPAFLEKERHFFDRFFDEPWADRHTAEYHAWFPRPEGRVTGEWTPRYLVDHWTPPLLQQAAPEARLLVMLRDPVERYVSGVAHVRREGDPITNLVANEQGLRGLYHQTLRHWLRWFPADQVLVLQYERCVAAPLDQLARTWAFLGLDPERHPTSSERLERRVNVGDPTLKTELNPEHEQALRAFYRPDMEELAAAFPEIDLALWPSWTD